MIIRLEDIDERKGYPLYVGNRSRLATATGVALLDSARLVVTSFTGHRMYLVRFDFSQGTHQILSCIRTEYSGDEIRTDLIDFDGRDRIVTSNCEFNSVSLYRVAKDRLLHVKDVPIRDTSAKFCHGARFVPGETDIVCASCTGSQNIYFITSTTSEILFQFGLGEWRPHDICFVDDKRMIVVCTKGHPTKLPGPSYEAKVLLVEFDLNNRVHQVIGGTVFQKAHMDCCHYHAGRLYINNQMQDTVVVCKLVGDQINFELEISGYSFPHGLDLLSDTNLLAVTNYGTNTIVLSQV